MDTLTDLQRNYLSAAVTDFYEQDIEVISGAIYKREPSELLRRKVIIYFPSISDDELHQLLRYCGVKETIIHDENYHYEKVNVFLTDVRIIPDKSQLADSAKPTKG